MSGTAAVCSASVTSTCARVDPDRRNLPRRERGRHDPAAGQLAHRDDRVVRPRRHVVAAAASARTERDQLAESSVQRRGRAPPASSAPTSAEATPRCRSSRSPSSFAASSASPVAGEAAGLDEPIGDLRHRRHDDDRRLVGRMWSRAGRLTMSITRLIASASATEVPPNFMMTFTAVPRGASARRSGSPRPPRRESCCVRARRTCSRRADTAGAARR